MYAKKPLQTKNVTWEMEVPNKIYKIQDFKKVLNLINILKCAFEH